MFFRLLSQSTLMAAQYCQLFGKAGAYRQAGGIQKLGYNCRRLAAREGGGAQVVDQSGGLEAVEPVVKCF